MKIKQRFPVAAWQTSEGWDSTGLAYEDYTRFATHIHKESGERRLPTPTWALNNKQFAAVLVTFMEERSGLRKPSGGDLRARLKRAQDRIHAVVLPSYRKQLIELCAQYMTYKRNGRYSEWSDEQVREEYTRKFKKDALPFTDTVLAPRYRMESNNIEKTSILIENRDTFIRESDNPTAGAGIIARVVYLYYCAGLDSVGVAGELGLKPPHVRQILWRLADTGARVSQQTEIEAATARRGETADADDKVVDAPLFALIDSVNRESEVEAVEATRVDIEHIAKCFEMPLEMIGHGLESMAQTFTQATEAASAVNEAHTQHGTVKAYKRGCRCKECKAANAAYEKARYDKAKAQRAKATEAQYT